MASIVKRKKKYSVVYTYTDENGNKRQKWETFETNAEAKKRKLQVEYEQESGTFIPPSAKTVNDLLDEYMSIYGVNTWAMSTYESRKSLIANYIRPLIGDMKLEDVTPRIMDKYYRDLLSVKAVSSKYVKARTEYLTPHGLVADIKSADVLGKDTGESGRQVQRFIRLTNLIPELLDMIDQKQISFNPAVELSYPEKG